MWRHRSRCRRSDIEHGAVLWTLFVANCLEGGIRRHTKNSSGIGKFKFTRSIGSDGARIYRVAKSHFRATLGRAPNHTGERGISREYWPLPVCARTKGAPTNVPDQDKTVMTLAFTVRSFLLRGTACRTDGSCLRLATSSLFRKVNLPVLFSAGARRFIPPPAPRSSRARSTSLTLRVHRFVFSARRQRPKNRHGPPNCSSPMRDGDVAQAGGCLRIRLSSEEDI